jgi:transposase
MLPRDFPPWQPVYWWFRRFVRRLLFNTIHDIALMVDRERAGREASPSAAVIDSQHVLPRRWVVERTFGWMMRWRCLVRDYEQRLAVSKAMIHIALGCLLLRRIAH